MRPCDVAIEIAGILLLLLLVLVLLLLLLLLFPPEKLPFNAKLPLRVASLGVEDSDHASLADEEVSRFRPNDVD